jgi:hypothetical protein
MSLGQIWFHIIPNCLHLKIQNMALLPLPLFTPLNKVNPLLRYNFGTTYGG